MKTDVDEYGYRAAAARRKRLVAAQSPAVQARIAGTRADYESLPTAGRVTVDLATGTRTIVKEADTSELRTELRALRRQLDSLRGEVAELREEREQAVDSSGVAEVVECFLDQLAHVGYRIGGERVTLADLRRDRLGAAWARPRTVAMWLSASIMPEATLTEVGRFFGRDHTTVLHARRKIGRVLAKVPRLRDAALGTCAAQGVEAPAALKSKP
jgi:hypothetical protein